MTRYWAIDERNFEARTVTVSLKSGNKVWIGEGDAVIFFARSHGVLFFTSKAAVVSAELEEDQEGFLFEARLTSVEDFTEARKLDDFAFTLSKIYRYLKPYVHFLRPYVELSQEDYKALVEGTIFWSRTAIGLFVIQLPRSQIVKFFKVIADFQPNFLFEGSGYESVWVHLARFIEEEYLAAGLILAAIRGEIQLLKESGGPNLPYERFSLSSDEEDGVSDSLAEQEKLFLEFLKVLIIKERTNVLEEVGRRIEAGHETEESFDKKFRGTPWPIVRTVI